MLIFRLLPIWSLAYLCSMCAMSSSASLDRGVSAILKNSNEFRSKSFKLYSHCSGNNVQIDGETVNARGLHDSTYVNMSFISVHTRHHAAAINIMGQKTGRYLCFDKKGKLKVRLQGKKKLCLFVETLNGDHYTVLRSVYNPEWYVGFNKRGNPLKGNLYSKAKLQNCFHFTKKESSNRLIKYPTRKPKLMSRKHSHQRPQKLVPKSPIR